MSKKSFGIGLVLGAGAGIVSAYLFAPQPGEVLQSELADKTDQTKKKAILALDEAVTEAETWIDNKKTKKNIENEPVVYEKTEQTVTTPPKATSIEP